MPTEGQGLGAMPPPLPPPQLLPTVTTALMKNENRDLLPHTSTLLKAKNTQSQAGVPMCTHISHTCTHITLSQSVP